MVRKLIYSDTTFLHASEQHHYIFFKSFYSYIIIALLYDEQCLVSWHTIYINASLVNEHVCIIYVPLTVLGDIENFCHDISCS